MTTFSFEQVEQDIFEPFLVVVDVKDEGALPGAIKQWTKALQLTGGDAILKREEFEENDPWFGFGARLGKRVLSEAEVFAALDSKAVRTVEAFVKALIAFNTKNKRTLEGGLVTHEEYETGSGAIEWLVTQDLAYLPLYLKYLATLDLDHTVEQVTVVLRLSKVYSAKQLAPLIAWAGKAHAQLLNDWLANERAWNDD